jgi:hypothetical protein
MFMSQIDYSILCVTEDLIDVSQIYTRSVHPAREFQLLTLSVCETGNTIFLT